MNTNNESPKEVVIAVNDVSKSLNQHRILTDISMRVYKNEIVGLIGPNGAGKTTLLYILTGLMVPDTGDVTIGGYRVSDQKKQIAPFINFASSSHRLNGYATVYENLMTYARLYSVKRPEEKIRRLSKAFEIFHLLESGTKVYSLSAGENAKVNVSKAFLNDPLVIFLDEITAHADERSKNMILAFIRKYCAERKATVLYVSHSLQEVSALCDRVLELKNGRIYSKKLQ